MIVRVKQALAVLALLHASTEGTNHHGEPDKDPHRYVVKFKKKKGLIQAHHSLRGSPKISMLIKDQKAAVMDMGPDEAEDWSQRDDVDYVEKDQKVYVEAEEVPYGIHMVEALQVDDDSVSNRMVCIVDSGYDVNHPDLPKSSGVVTGAADGGAGPWNRDNMGHGTHVAGTIAAIGGNHQGVAGVTRNGQLRLHIVRVFDAMGWAWASDVVSAVDECVKVGSNVVSMSLGRPGDPLQYEAEAYNSFFANGILLVASAGNYGNRAHNWPASYDAVISVGAVDWNKDLASFSQRTNQVELVAPGVDVISTTPGGGYAQYSGTSMAAPHVSGVAALVWSHFPTKPATDIRRALTTTAQDLGPAGRDHSYGYGLVQAYKAYEYLGGGSSPGGGKLYAATTGNRLYMREPVPHDVRWTDIGHAYHVVAMTALNDKLYCITSGDRLYMRDPVSWDIGWTDIGHARNVVAMTALNGKLYCVTDDDRLFVRDPVPYDVGWTHIGQARSVVAMTALNGKLYCATSGDKLYMRDPVPYDIGWTHIGHAQNVVAMTALSGKLYCATSGDKLFMRDPVPYDIGWTHIGQTIDVVGMAAL